MPFGKKRKKATRFRGSHTHGRGFKKKARGSGHQGGVGLAGTGKRGDAKKTLVLNLYGNDYFGKSKALRKKPIVRLEVINLATIAETIQTLIKKNHAKETGKNEFTLDLKKYKILGDGELNGMKLKITAAAASKSAIDKVKKAGGDIVLQR